MRKFSAERLNELAYDLFDPGCEGFTALEVLGREMEPNEINFYSALLHSTQPGEWIKTHPLWSLLEAEGHIHFDGDKFKITPYFLLWCTLTLTNLKSEKDGRLN